MKTHLIVITEGEEKTVDVLDFPCVPPNGTFLRWGTSRSPVGPHVVEGSQLRIDDSEVILFIWIRRVEGL